MYAAHLAAGLAVKGHAPKAPAWTLLTAAFLADGVWIALAAAGIEPAYGVFFDEWSHSLVSILAEATLFALCFYRWGREVWLPVWIAGASHFLLDWPIHPAPIAAYPHASMHLGWQLWDWGLAKSPMGPSHYWWIQLAVVVVLLAIYVRGAMQGRLRGQLIAASVAIVVGLHLLL
jgi:hypothetical protein